MEYRTETGNNVEKGTTITLTAKSEDNSGLNNRINNFSKSTMKLEIDGLQLQGSCQEEQTTVSKTIFILYSENQLGF